MARMKWNPATGRYESAGGVDNPPPTASVGSTYVDTVTGQTKQRMPQGVDLVISTAAPKSSLVAPKNPVKANTATATTTPTTAAPKGATVSSAPAGSQGKINIKGRGMGGPTAAQVSSGQVVGGAAQVADESNVLQRAVKEAYESGDWAAVTALVSLMNGGSGSGSNVPSKESLAASYNAAITAANMTQKAGKKAQNAYNMQGQNLYNTQVEAIKKYYGDQSDVATKLIDKAGADFMATMPSATAYANAQVANLPQAQQGLTGALEAYGATGQQAQGVSDQNKAYLDALAKMQSSSNAQLSEADKTYMASLRTAAEGNRMQAKQTLAGNIGSLQAQDTSAADATRQGLITKGIDTMLAAQTDAAGQKAKAVTDFGIPKKKPKPKTPKK